MNSGLKKTVILFVVVVIVVAVGVGVYLGLQKFGLKIPGISTPGGGVLPVGVTGSGTSVGGLLGYPPSGGQAGGNQQEVPPVSQQQQLSIISVGVPVGFWISSSSAIGDPIQSFSSSSVFYINNSGDVVQITAPGVEKTISSSNLGQPLWLMQNSLGDSVVVKFTGGQFVIFDVKSKIWQPLDDGITAAAFSPDGKRLVYLRQGQNTQSLYIRDVVRGKVNLTLVASLAVNDVNLYWASANNIVLVDKPSFSYRGHAWQINLSTKTVSYLDSDVGLELSFSPYSNNFGMRFASSGQGVMAVTLFDNNHKQIASLPFSTVAEKCAFSFNGLNAFCAVPYQNSSDGTLTLPDNFMMGGVYFKDYLYSVNLKDATINDLINIPNLSIDAVQLTSARGELFFLNRLDGKLYLLKLSQ